MSNSYWATVSRRSCDIVFFLLHILPVQVGRLDRYHLLKTARVDQRWRVCSRGSQTGPRRSPSFHLPSAASAPGCWHERCWTPSQTQRSEICTCELKTSQETDSAPREHHQQYFMCCHMTISSGGRKTDAEIVSEMLNQTPSHLWPAVCSCLFYITTEE